MRALLLIAALTLGLHSFGQMSGTYTVGNSPADFQTIQSALLALENTGVNGDVFISIEAGVYQESLDFNFIPGTSFGARVTIGSADENRDMVTLSSGTTSGIAIWNIAEARNYTFRELTFSNLTTGSTPSVRLDLDSDGVVFEGCNFSTDGDGTPTEHILTDGGSGTVTISDCRFEDAILGMTANGSNFSNLTVTGSEFADCIQMLSITNYALVDINDCSFTAQEMGPSGNGIYMRGNIAETTIAQNTFSGNLVSSIDYDVPSGEVTLEANQFSATSSQVFLSSATQVSVLNNICAADGHTQVKLRSCSNNLIQNNELNGLKVFNFAGSLLVDNNTFDHSQEAGKAVLIENAILTETGADMISNNVFKGDVNCTPLEIAALTTTLTDKRFSVQNNSLANMSNALIFRLNEMPVDFLFNSIAASGNQTSIFDLGEMSATVFKNNIVSCPSCEGVSLYNNPSSTEYIATNNIYDWEESNTGMAYSMGAEQAAIVTLADAQTAGFEANSIMAAPQFYDAMSDLKVCNPAVHAQGVAVPGVTTDMFGNMRNSAPTPGIFEYMPLNATFVSLSDEQAYTFLATDLSAAQEVLWDFGDGTTSTEAIPTHTFPVEGTFTVTLTVNNFCGVPTTTSEVLTFTTTSLVQEESRLEKIYPNPFSNELRIDLFDAATSGQTVSAIDITGREVMSVDINAQTSTDRLIVDTSDWMTGVYFLQISDNNIIRETKRVVKR